jgi:hypothetical protein
MLAAARSLRLYVTALLTFAHRLRHDMAREVVVFISSLVLLATFLYVFNDFLNVQVSSLSATMRLRFAQAAFVVLHAVSTGAGVRLLRDELYSQVSLRGAALRLGERRGVVTAYLALRFATVLTCVHGLAWYATYRWLFVPDAAVTAGIEAGLLVATAVAAALPTRPRTAREPRAAATTARAPDPVGATGQEGAPEPLRRALTRWRLRQILGRNRLTRLCLALAVPFVAAATLAAARAAPPFVPAAAGLAAGLLVAFALAFQMAEDLEHAWLERGFGISHADFVATYERLALALGLPLAASLFLLCAVASGFAHPADAAKAGAVALVPVLVAPWLLMQIDGRRPAIGALTIVIVALFVGTAVLAHWLGLILLLPLRHFAAQTQDNRFYRA